MILHKKVIVIEEDDDFDEVNKKMEFIIRGCRPEYVMCPKRRIKEFRNSDLFKYRIAPMFNIRSDKEHKLILYDRRIR